MNVLLHNGLEVFVAMLRSTRTLIATPRRRLTLLPLALVGSFAAGLSLSLLFNLFISYHPTSVRAAGETNVMDQASYKPTSDFYQEHVLRFEVNEANGIGTADITVSPPSNGITRQVN